MAVVLFCVVTVLLLVLCRLCGRLRAGCLPALIVGLLVLALLLIGLIVRLLTLLPPLRALHLPPVPLDLSQGDEVAPGDLLGLDGPPPHRMLHRSVGQAQDL